MCGIVASYHRAGRNIPTEKVISSMLDELRFRGPDEKSIFGNQNVFLGHTRLSIIDLHTGSQPLFNENKTVATILNGEIYNFIELREQLLRAGHTFKTASDTEVIVHLYEDHGEDLFKYLNGMFSIVIYDLKENLLLIGRDRMGEKPLLYSDSQERFLCASEVKALLKYPDLSRELDNNTVAAYLNTLYVPAPLSIFKSIRKLEPAHYLKVTQNGTEKIKYWNPDVRVDRTLSEEDIVEEFTNIFNDSVKNKMISDVPLGAFLSGGIDSSAVVAFMARNSTRPIKTFSVGFDAEINELPFAKKVAERYKTDHTEIIIQSDIRDVLPEVVRYYDEPFADNSNIPTWLISKEAKKHVKVILTGDGGDELFAGYGSYLTQRYYSNSRILSKLMRVVDGASVALTHKTCLDWSYPYQSNKGAIQNWLSIKECFNQSEIEKLCKFPFENPRRLLSEQPFLKSEIDDSLSIAYAHDFNYYLPDDLLKKVDMASMANGLETRTPFLDYRLVEFSMKIAPELKVKNNQSKYLLKKALTELLPRDILYREKQGFGAPIAAWIHGPLKEIIQDTLSAGCKLEGFLNREKIKDIVDNVYSESSQDWRANHKLWVLFIFELWMREYA